MVGEVFGLKRWENNVQELRDTARECAEIIGAAVSIIGGIHFLTIVGVL